MKFCTKCGKTISILDPSKSELCSTCTERLPPQKTDPTKSVENTDLLSAKISHKEGKLILESKEGWLLWSGPDKTPHSLEQIIDRAERILNIRKRQNK